MRSISCPWCGTYSSLTTELPMEPRSWTQECPACNRPWNLKVWIKRGTPELLVEPGTPKKAPPASKKPARGKTAAATKPTAKKAAAKKAAPKKAAPKKKVAKKKR